MSTWAEDFQKEIFAKIARAEQGAHKIAKQIKADTNDRIPIASGDLRNSYDYEIERKEGKISIICWYASEYAIKQHEKVLNHVSFEPIRKAFQEFAGQLNVGPKGKWYWKGFFMTLHSGQTVQYDTKYLEKSLDLNAGAYLELMKGFIDGRS